MSTVGYSNPWKRLVWLLPGGVRDRPAAPVDRDVEIVGHRGAPRAAAENTLSSFDRAIAAGAEALETDVCVTRDGKLVLWHDRDPTATLALARESGREDLLARPDVPHLFSRRRRPISRLDWATFHRFYGYRVRTGGWRDWLGSGDGRPPIPAATLDDLLHWAPRQDGLSRIYLDLKFTASQAGAVEPLVDRLGEFFRDGDSGRRLNFGCLCRDAEILLELNRHAARRPVAGRIEVFGDFELPGALDFASRLGLENVSMGLGQRLWAGFRRELSEVVAARNRGRLRRVIVWTFNEPDRIATLLEMGVDGILTDDTDLLRRMVASRPTARRNTASS